MLHSARALQLCSHRDLKMARKVWVCAKVSFVASSMPTCTAWCQWCPQQRKEELRLLLLDRAYQMFGQREYLTNACLNIAYLTEKRLIK